MQFIHPYLLIRDLIMLLKEVTPFFPYVTWLGIPHQWSRGADHLVSCPKEGYRVTTASSKLLVPVKLILITIPLHCNEPVRKYSKKNSVKCSLPPSIHCTATGKPYCADWLNFNFKLLCYWGSSASHKLEKTRTTTSSWTNPAYQWCVSYQGHQRGRCRELHLYCNKCRVFLRGNYHRDWGC